MLKTDRQPNEWPVSRGWRIVIFAAVVIPLGCFVVFVAGCASDPRVATFVPAGDPRLPIRRPPIDDLTNYRTRPHSDGRPRIETVSYPVVWIDDVASEEVTRLERDGLLVGGEAIAIAWFGDDSDLLGAYGVPKGATAVLEYRVDDEASVYVVGYQDTPPPHCPIAAESFLWSHDATGGIAIIYVVENPKYQPGVEQLAQPQGDVRIEATSTGRLTRHWEIDGAAAYFIDEGRRLRCLVEGPFPWEVRDTGPNERAYVWTMHRLTRPEYEFVLLLHKKQDGMFLDAVEQAVRRQAAITFRVETQEPYSTSPMEPDL